MTQQPDRNELRRETGRSEEVSRLRTKETGDRPAVIPADEETEGATGALETPATPPEMSKDGKVDSNRRKERS